jgi:hypothetical protein
MPDHLYMSVELAQIYIAASNQDKRRSLLAEKKKGKKEKKKDGKGQDNNQAAQAIDETGKKASGINQGQAGESETMKVEDV